MTPARKPVVGVIGGIGAGKSVASAAFAKHGGRVIDADRLGHLALELPDVRQALVRRWGERIVKADGTVDRHTIAGIVFQNDAERRALEALVFPPIGRLAEQAIAKANADSEVRFVVLDAAMLLEAGWQGYCDRILYVDAPKDLRVARLAARSGWSPEELARREAAQWPTDAKRARSDAVMMNDGPPERLHEQIDQLVKAWDL